MATSPWAHVAGEFHERVKSNCWDTLAGELLNLHQPWLDDDGLPVCRGCDRDTPGTTDPVWPCRTYTIIAATMLTVPNVEATLRAMLTAQERRVTST